MKKIALILVVLILAGLAGWKFWPRRAVAKGQSADPNQADLAVVKRASIRVLVESTGSVVANEEVQIKCKASGEVIKLPLDVSDVVKKGDLLLQLDPQDEERSVKRAEVNLAMSQAKLAQAALALEITRRNLATERRRAEAALPSAEAKAGEAEAKLRRTEQLLQKKMASPEDYEAARTASAQAQADLESARARIEDLKTQEVSIKTREQDVRIAEAQVASDNLSLSDAQQRLSDTTVVSPIDGVVAERNVQVGTIIASGINNVGGGTTVMTLVDLSHVYVLASVDESDIGRIQPGQPVRITVDAYPDVTFPGEVVRVATKGVEKSNVVTFEVKIEVKGRQRNLLKPQMTANVSIVAVERNDVLVVPVAAVGRRRAERYVMVPGDNGTATERVVQVGASDGEVMEITDGLAEGDTVMVNKGGAGGRWRAGDDQSRRDAMRREGMRMRMMGGGGGPPPPPR